MPSERGAASLHAREQRGIAEVIRDGGRSGKWMTKSAPDKPVPIQ